MAQRNSITGWGWLTPTRVERWSWIFLGGYLIFFLALIGTAHGLNDIAGRPLGADFSSFYSAGTLGRLGHSPYDQNLLYQTERSLFGSATPYFGFAYPPLFLLLLAPLSWLSYPLALSVWQIGTLTIYAVSMMRLRQVLTSDLPRRPFLLASLAFTSIFVSLSCGQNGLLSAALFTFAITFFDARPLAAGIFIGFLTFKPQLGLLIPFALAASGRWRLILGAALTASALCALSTALFGVDIWRDFLTATNESRQLILDQGRVGYYKMVSIFAAARLLGAPAALAYAAQAVSVIVALATTLLVWHSRCDFRLQVAVLSLATFLATPFALDYDVAIVAPALALMASYGSDKGLGALEAASLALLWVTPMLARAAGLAHIPIMILLIAASLFLIVRVTFNSSTRRITGDLQKASAIPR